MNEEMRPATTVDRRVKYRDGEGRLTTQTVQVKRTESVEWAGYEDLRPSTDIGGAVLNSLPRMTVKPLYGRGRNDSTYAITGAKAEHIWNGREWFTKRSLSVVKLTKAGGAWGGYPRINDFGVNLRTDSLPAEVAEFFDRAPTPTTQIVMTETEMEK